MAEETGSAKQQHCDDDAALQQRRHRLSTAAAVRRFCTTTEGGAAAFRMEHQHSRKVGWHPQSPRVSGSLGEGTTVEGVNSRNMQGMDCVQEH